VPWPAGVNEDFAVLIRWLGLALLSAAPDGPVR
jgi:hypothetical protein